MEQQQQQQQQQPAKIYKIVSDDGPESYIGSTYMSLDDRFYLHQHGKGDCTSARLLNSNGVRVELVEEIVNPNRERVAERERYHILNTTNHVNKNIPKADLRRIQWYERATANGPHRCECGLEITNVRYVINRHLVTNRHRERMVALNGVEGRLRHQN